MIKNERQYRITKSQVDNFSKALAEVRDRIASANQSEILKWKLQESALKSQWADLEADLREYENLQGQRHGTIEINSLEELPDALIKARIAAGLTQRQLAERLGLKEQQIQRYEATGYFGANLNRVQEILDALGVKITKQLVIPELPVTTSSLFHKLADLGFKKDFVEKKLISPELRARIENEESSPDLEAMIFTAAANISRIFNCAPADLFSSIPLHVPEQALSYARFKLPANARRTTLPAYTVYAHFLALLLIQATPHVSTKTIPASWRHVRNQIIERFGDVTLLNVVRYIWDLGVVILPLKDSGHFHAATWRFRGRNVIVVKQQTSSEARWIIDLLHELWHASQSQENPEHAVIEADSVYLTADQIIEEQIATDFAADVVFKGRADELAEDSAAASNHRMEWLKAAVQKVAHKNGVRTDLLANYMAYRLSLEGQNWWGTASRLQQVGPDPWECVRDFVAGNIKWDSLHGSDRQLLEQALQNQEFSYEKPL
ncbi:MAG TPA: helix-turn-helix transcriptional regulator [Bryobacteraceae bacterium]|nr:helix-turn-helix transcriptional regulator [Bryobacteraceae bacterium]